MEVKLSALAWFHIKLDKGGSSFSDLILGSKNRARQRKRSWANPQVGPILTEVALEWSNGHPSSTISLRNVNSNLPLLGRFQPDLMILLQRNSMKIHQLFGNQLWNVWKRDMVTGIFRTFLLLWFMCNYERLILFFQMETMIPKFLAFRRRHNKELTVHLFLNQFILVTIGWKQGLGIYFISGGPNFDNMNLDGLLVKNNCPNSVCRT